MYIFLFFSLLLCTGQGLWAQVQGPIYPPEQAIEELKGGEAVLVLRLRSYATQLDMRRKVLKNPKLSERQRKRQERDLANLEFIRDEVNLGLLEAAQDFDFCKLYIMYDTSGSALLRGHTEGLLIDTTGALEAGKTPLKFLQGQALDTTKQVFLLKMQDRGQEFPFDVLRVMPLRGQLQRPFPYYVAVRSSWRYRSPRNSVRSSLGHMNKLLQGFWEKQERKKAKAAEKAAQD